MILFLLIESYFKVDKLLAFTSQLNTKFGFFAATGELDLTMYKYRIMA